MFASFIILVIEFTLRTVILAALLWIMIKIQRLQYNMLGVFASAALASGLDLIPYVGHYLAVPVLYICIWRVTREDLFPDAVFTVAVSYALMFGVQLFFLGALMGELRPSARSADAGEDPPEAMVSEVDSVAETNVAPAAAPKASRTLGKAEKSPGAQGTLTAATNSVRTEPTRSEQIASQFIFEGLTRNSRQSALLVHTGVRTYTIIYGEPELVQTKLGVVPVRFDELGKDYVVLSVDGEPVKLSLK